MTAIAIIGAMDEEVANIATALSNVTVTEEAGVKVTRGTLETNKGTAVNVAATVGGMGTVNIAATTQHLIDADQPDAVIFSGIAGNLKLGAPVDLAPHRARAIHHNDGARRVSQRGTGQHRQGRKSLEDVAHGHSPTQLTNWSVDQLQGPISVVP